MIEKNSPRKQMLETAMWFNEPDIESKGRCVSQASNKRSTRKLRPLKMVGTPSVSRLPGITRQITYDDEVESRTNTSNSENTPRRSDRLMKRRRCVNKGYNQGRQKKDSALESSKDVTDEEDFRDVTPSSRVALKKRKKEKAEQNLFCMKRRRAEGGKFEEEPDRPRKRRRTVTSISHEDNLLPRDSIDDERNVLEKTASQGVVFGAKSDNNFSEPGSCKSCEEPTKNAVVRIMKEFNLGDSENDIFSLDDHWEGDEEMMEECYRLLSGLN